MIAIAFVLGFFIGALTMLFAVMAGCAPRDAGVQEID